MNTFPESVTRSTELLGLTRSVVKRMLRAMNPNSTELHDKLQPNFQQVLQRFFDARAHELAAVDAVIPGAKAEIRALQNADEARDFPGALAALRDTIMGAWQVDFDLRASLLPTGLILLTSMTMLLAGCAAPDGSNPLMVPTLNVPTETATPEISPTADQLIDVTPTPSPEATTAPTDQWLTPTELTPEATQPITATATMTETVTPTSTATPTATSTQEFTPTPSVPMAVLSSKTNVRQGPGTNYDVVNRAATNQQLRITGQIQIGADLWLQVADEAAKVIGFVRSDVVVVNGSLGSVPEIPAASLPPTPTRAPTATSRPATPTSETPPTKQPEVPASNLESLLSSRPPEFLPMNVYHGTETGSVVDSMEFFAGRVESAVVRVNEEKKLLRIVVDLNNHDTRIRATIYLPSHGNIDYLPKLTKDNFTITSFCSLTSNGHCVLNPALDISGDPSQEAQAIANKMLGRWIAVSSTGLSGADRFTYVAASTTTVLPW